MNATSSPDPGSSSAGRHATLPGTRILLVEDDELLRIALASFLSTAGGVAIEVGDAEAAVEVVSAGGVDVVLSDVQLPGRSGVWLADQAQAVRPDLPVILMSGALPAAGGGTPPSVRHFFRKPIDPEALLRVLLSVHPSRGT